MRLHNKDWRSPREVSFPFFFFLAPHGTCRRDQEKRPAHIVCNQRKGQGRTRCILVPRFTTWDACGKPRCITLHYTWQIDNRCQKLNIGRLSMEIGDTGETAMENREWRGGEKLEVFTWKYSIAERTYIGYFSMSAISECEKYWSNPTENILIR